MKRLNILFLLIAALAFATTARPSISRPAERFSDVFQPFRTTAAALSPDGRHLAYSVRENGKTWLVVVELSNPGKIKGSLYLGTDASATPMFSDTEEDVPLAVSWMRWITPNRLLALTNQISVHGYFSAPGVYVGMNADGSDAQKLLDSYELNQAIPSMATFGPTRYGGDASIAPDGILPLEGGFFERNGRGQIRSSSFFDYSSRDPESIVVLAPTGLRGNWFFELNASTGKLKILDYDYGASGHILLHDRQRRTRLGLNGSPTAYPIPYLVDKRKPVSWGRWKNLDEVLHPPVTASFLISPENYFRNRSIPMGFDDNSDILYYASNMGRDTFGVYGLNMKTGLPSGFAVEVPGVDLIAPPLLGFAGHGLVYNRFDRKLCGIRYTDKTRQTAHWLKPELAEAQRDLEANFPKYNLEILDWDRDYANLLVLVHNSATPGTYAVFKREKKHLLDIARRSSVLEDRPIPTVIPFSFTTSAGEAVYGHLTYPVAGRFDRVPLVVVCPTQPWLRTPLAFKPETAALTDMGFAVLHVESRGAWGFGVKQRESIKQGYETVLASDIVFAIDSLAKTYRINPQRVALLGEGYGGYVALRALQLEPDRFRCAVTIDAPLDLYSWIENDRWTRGSKAAYLTKSYFGSPELLREAPLVRHPEKITKPVCLLAWPGVDGYARTSIYLETRQFADALRRQGVPVELNELDKSYTRQTDDLHGAESMKSSMLELDREFAQRLPHAQAAAYRHIEYFLNAYIYDYKVKLGPLKALPTPEN